METIRTKSIIEIVGKPKEHITQTMQKVVELIESNEKFSLTDKKIAETKEVKGLWSTFGEFEIDFSKFEDIGTFCFEFMPSSLEIISPEELKIDSKEVEEFTNDVLAKLHQYDMVVKQMILQQKGVANLQKKED
tara:strand:- start:593 stop:994 length:402 start_codon:yes stop_codon:yes gene_type:complete